jgi:DNA polymerase-1
MGWRKYVPYARAQYGIAVTDSEAEHLRAAFFARYPGLRAWHQRQRRVVDALGYVESPIGRRRRLPAVSSSDKEMQAEAQRQAINSPVQGLASDFTLLAMSRIHEFLQSEPVYTTRARIVGQVHDSILIEAEEEIAEYVAADAKRIMETLPLQELFGWQPTVPIVADTKISRFWGGD